MTWHETLTRILTTTRLLGGDDSAPLNVPLKQIEDNLHWLRDGVADLDATTATHTTRLNGLDASTKAAYLQITEMQIRNGIGHAAYESPGVGTRIPVPLRGRPQFILPSSASTNRVHAQTGWAAGPTVPNFANIGGSDFSVAVDHANDRALVSLASTTSHANRLCRWDSGAWAAQSLPVSYQGRSFVAFIGTTWFCAQADGAIYKSTTGATGSWTAATALPANTDHRHFGNNQAYSGSIWCGCPWLGAGLSTGYILRTANDGTTWSAALVPGTTPYVYGVTWDPLNSRFLAVGSVSAGTTPAAWVSTDGITWTALAPVFRGFGGSTILSFRSVCQVNGVLVALLGAVGVATSVDGGVTWNLCLAWATSDALFMVAGRNDLLFVGSSAADHWLARF